MNFKQIKKIMLYVLIAIFAIPAFTFANTSEGGLPEDFIIGGSDTTGADIILVPPTPEVIIVGGSDTTGADANPIISSVVSSGGSSSGSRSNNFIAIATSSASIATTSISCNYLTGYLKFGAENDSVEVTKLQTFLKNIENINVDINGKFDDKTFEGVKAFQAKYIDETMSPWGSRTPSGQVFFTTKKKINEIYCKSSFALTAEQLAQINVYKNNLAQGIVGTNSLTPANTSPINSEIGSSGNINSQTAAIVNTPVTTKVWNFIKWLFGK